MNTQPELIIDIQTDGDFILNIPTTSGTTTPTTGLRVSSQALSFASPVFKDAFLQHGVGTNQTVLHLSDDDCHTIFLLCSILHLRNSVLPHRLSAEQLRRFALAAVKYKCVNAVSRVATMWFDNIYHDTLPDQALLSIESSYLLDDPLYFARFTSQWVQRSEYTNDSLLEIINLPYAKNPAELKAPHFLFLLPKLIARRAEALNLLRNEIELLIDPLGQGLSSETRHRVDQPPGDGVDDDSDDDEDDSDSDNDAADANAKPKFCTIDRMAATTYLSALRDANLWPSTRWPTRIAEVVRELAEFQPPECDDEGESCSFCESVPLAFRKVFERVKGMHDERLWGLCLDCVGAESGSEIEGGGGGGGGQLRFAFAAGQGDGNGKGGMKKGCRVEHVVRGKELVSTGNGGGQLMIMSGGQEEHAGVTDG